MTDIKPGDRVRADDEVEIHLRGTVECVYSTGVIALVAGDGSRTVVHPAHVVSVEVIPPPIPAWEEALRAELARDNPARLDDRLVAAVRAALEPTDAKCPGCSICGNAPPTAEVLTDKPKSLKEALCVAQQAVSGKHKDLLQDLIDECDRLRPVGPDGKHGNRHTPWCGCDDIDPEPQAAEPESWQPGDVVLDATGIVWERTTHRLWWQTGDGAALPDDVPERPLRLLVRDGKAVT